LESSPIVKIISVRQPWAGLIVHGIKDVENRTWPTRYRKPFLIHAALRTDAVTADEIERRFAARVPLDLPLGAIVGVATIVDCVRKHPSKWFQGPHGFALTDARPLPFLKYKGALSLRDAPEELLQQLGLEVQLGDCQASWVAPARH
jgi:ASCH domain-containing protein